MMLKVRILEDAYWHICTKMETKLIKTKKKKTNELREEIGIPEGINTELTENKLTMKKEGEELNLEMHPFINARIEKDKIIIGAKRSRRTEKRLFGTMKAHIKNMIKGLTEGFTYKLKIVNVHFPINVSHDKISNELIVKNFLGEKKDRRIKLDKDVSVKIENDTIEVSSFNIEKAGQVATNIEKGTKVRNKDRRVFQDGIFIVEKPGRVYL